MLDRLKIGTHITLFPVKALNNIKREPVLCTLKKQKMR